MKKYLFLILFIFPFLAKAQEIKSNVIDGFTNERTIETSMVTLKQGFSTGFGVSYTAVNTASYINIIGYGRNRNLTSDIDSVWFFLDNGVIAKLNSPIEIAGEETSFQNMYLTHYYIRLDMVEAMRDHPVLMIKIISGSEHSDLPISKKNAKSLVKLSDIFLKEVSKGQ